MAGIGRVYRRFGKGGIWGGSTRVLVHIAIGGGGRGCWLCLKCLHEEGKEEGDEGILEGGEG